MNNQLKVQYIKYSLQNAHIQDSVPNMKIDPFTWIHYN